MDNLLSVIFEAHNDERNNHRRYAIRVGRDLFGEWTVSLTYGRAGQGGQEVRHASTDRDQLRQVIRESLRRRLSAPRRIGCPYHLKGLNAARGVDIGTWLPADLMTKFLSSGDAVTGPNRHADEACSCSPAQASCDLLKHERIDSSDSGGPFCSSRPPIRA